MLIPPFLKPGDTIGICAQARKVSLTEIQPAITIFKQWGLNVKLSKHLFNEYHQFSGTDAERANDLQELINSPEVNAIISARGGYGTLRIIDRLNFNPLKQYPKWICGFSDLTVLHAHINKHLPMATLHSTMPINFLKNNIAVQSLKNLLFGEPFNYTIPVHTLNRTGKAHGKIIGGNLSLIYALSGSTSDIDTSGKILFLEDLDEYLYHIDRMMIQLKRSGKLKNLAALIVGSFSDIKDNTIPFGMTAYQIIKSHVEEYNYPVCFNFPAGHQEPNTALYFGVEASLIVEETKVELTYPHIIA
jgi:muramoyltetrapeptide carboxypeptidase